MYNQNLHQQMTVDKEIVANPPEQSKVDEINELTVWVPLKQ